MMHSAPAGNKRKTSRSPACHSLHPRLRLLHGFFLPVRASLRKKISKQRPLPMHLAQALRKPHLKTRKEARTWRACLARAVQVNGPKIRANRLLCRKLMDCDCFSSMSVCGSCWVVAADGADLSVGRMPCSGGGIKRKVAVLGLCFQLWTGGGARPPSRGRGGPGRLMWQGCPLPCCKVGVALPQHSVFANVAVFV